MSVKMSNEFLLLYGILIYLAYRFIDFVFPDLWEKNKYRKIYLGIFSILFGFVIFVVSITILQAMDM